VQDFSEFRGWLQSRSRVRAGGLAQPFRAPGPDSEVLG